MKLRNVNFNQHNVEKHYNHLMMPDAAFGCIVIDSDRTEVDNMKKHLEKLLMQSLKTPEKTSRNILHMLKEDGGHGLVDFIHMCNVTKLKKAIGSIREKINLG